MLPPLSLAALIAAVWLLPYRPDCDSLAWGNDLAIARVGSECIHLAAYIERLRAVERVIEYAEQGRQSEDSGLDAWQERHDLEISFGSETAVLASLLNASALYQRAVFEGHTPTDKEVYARRDEDRLRSESFGDYVQIAKLAQRQDVAGVRELLERLKHADMQDVLENMSLPDIIDSFQAVNWRQWEELRQEGEAYLESVGRDRHWNEIHPQTLRREMSVGILQEAVLQASADGPYEDVPRLAWLDYQQAVLENTEIHLTAAAPPTLSVEHALAYLASARELERQALNEEYRNFLERRQNRS